MSTEATVFNYQAVMRKVEDLFLVVRRFGLYLMLSAVILTEVGVVVGFAPRQWQEIGSLFERKAGLSFAVGKLTSALSVLRALDQKELAKELAQVDATLPDGKKTSGLVFGIGSIASASGVVLSSLEFSPGKLSTGSAQVTDEAVAGTKVRQVQAEVTIGGGDLSTLTTFLAKIYAASQLIGVDRVSFSASSGRQPTASIRLQVYFEPRSSEPVDWGKVRPLLLSEGAVLGSLSSQDVFTLPEERR